MKDFLKGLVLVDRAKWGVPRNYLVKHTAKRPPVSRHADNLVVQQLRTHVLCRADKACLLYTSDAADE